LTLLSLSSQYNAFLSSSKCTSNNTSIIANHSNYFSLQILACQSLNTKTRKITAEFEIVLIYLATAVTVYNTSLKVTVSNKMHALVVV